MNEKENQPATIEPTLNGPGHCGNAREAELSCVSVFGDCGSETVYYKIQAYWNTSVTQSSRNVDRGTKDFLGFFSILHIFHIV